MYFFIQGTKTTPSAIINDGYMKITGNSTAIDENNDFFGHFSRQVNLYSQQPANKTSIDIALEHVNATSKRYIIDLLKTLEKLKQQGFQVVINWHFEYENEDVKELGEIFDTMFDIDFNFVAT